MVHTGLDILLSGPGELNNKRVALITSYTALTSRFTFIWDEFLRAGLDLVRIFSPEHGIFGTEQDQVSVGREPELPVPVKSLYGADASSLRPAEEDLHDLDCIVFDIQDIGARYYTFVNTMIYVMREISGSGISFMVLDRPNPLGGAVEGPLLEPGYESFVGVMPAAVRHGMTAGELARFAVAHFNLDLDLTVKSMKGWSREMHFPETGLAWTPPSPNMPDYETALLYPGMCLIEGMNVSEGRGTTAPFRLIGAPWIDPVKTSAALNSLSLPGIVFVPHYFRPQFNKYAGEVCGGLRLHVTDAHALLPFLTGVAVVKVLSDLYEECSFLHGVYEFNDLYPAFDLLAGSSLIREMIRAGKSLDAIASSWKDDEDRFRKASLTSYLY